MMVEKIRITAPRGGFRRAGVSHPEGTTTYPADHFTEEQLKAFMAEPRLSVAPVFEEEDDDQGAEQKPATVTTPNESKSDGKSRTSPKKDDEKAK